MQTHHGRTSSEGRSLPNSALWKKIGVGAIIVAVAFALWRTPWSDLADLRPVWWWVALSLVLGVASRWTLARAWRRVLADTGGADLPGSRVTTKIFANAWIARYIPGTAPWVAGRALLAHEVGISKRTVLTSTLLEGLALTGIGIGLASLVLAIDGRLAAVSPWLVAAAVVLAVLCVLFLTRRGFTSLNRLMFRIVRRQPPDVRTSRAIHGALPTYGLAVLASGLTDALLVPAIGISISPADVTFLAAASVFAGAVGMLTPLVPSGLGTKDGTLLLLLLTTVPLPEATAITVATRVWSIAVDGVFWLLASYLARDFAAKG